MNRSGFSIIEMLSSAAFLAVACASICATASLSQRSLSKAADHWRHAVTAQSAIERSKGIPFDLLETGGRLEVFSVDGRTKSLKASSGGFEVHALRIKHE